MTVSPVRMGPEVLPVLGLSSTLGAGDQRADAPSAPPQLVTAGAAGVWRAGSAGGPQAHAAFTGAPRVQAE